MSLKKQLLQEGKNRWLDIGSGGKFEDGFECLDVYSEELIDEQRRRRYTRLDIVHAGAHQLIKLGLFDFIRMQHVFEHFSPEDGLSVLKNCASIMHPGAKLLITTPDLRIHIDKYLRGEYSKFKNFKEWAETRIQPDAPNSFYFSIFTHSMPYESHKWCYDFEGLKYQLEATGQFTQVMELKPDDPLSELPFTHNRPEEDVCALAVRR